MQAGLGQLKPVKDMEKAEKSAAWGWLKTAIVKAPSDIRTAYEAASVKGQRKSHELNGLLNIYVEGLLAKGRGELKCEWEHGDFQEFVRKESVEEAGDKGVLITEGRLKTLDLGRGRSRGS